MFVVVVVCHYLLVSSSCSYSLWYRRACPQPPLSNPTPGCIPGPLLVAADNIPADQTTYTLVGSGSNDPLPYTSYEFIVGAANREGSVNSSFSEPDTITPPSGKIKIIKIYYRAFWP